MVAMDPHLSNDNIRLRTLTSIVQTRRSPDMQRKLGEACGRVLVEEEDWIAKQDSYADGEEDEGKPMPSSCEAIAVEGSPQRMVGREDGRFCRTITRRNRQLWSDSWPHSSVGLFWSSKTEAERLLPRCGLTL